MVNTGSVVVNDPNGYDVNFPKRFYFFMGYLIGIVRKTRDAVPSEVRRKHPIRKPTATTATIGICLRPRTSWGPPSRALLIRPADEDN